MTTKKVSPSQNQSIQIMTRLREETKAYHAKLESLPYFKALIEHQLPLACYVNQLRALSVIHGVLEHEMATCRDRRVMDIWDDGLRKLPLLEEDLAFFKPRGLPDASDAIEAAHEAFSGLEVLYTALFPLVKTDVAFHVTRINPEAGNHPIPEDEREIQAALKASDRGWAEFPYYAQRYGDRGKRFSDSDTCWLVTLTALNPENLQKQIDWLCRVLATRGMPSLMLEYTLRFLYEELAKAVPENKASYGKLLRAADILKEARVKLIREKDFRELADEFERVAGSEMAHTLKNTGKLLVSAVVDEKSGIAGAVAALRGWLADADRFSAQWVLAVNEMLQKADGSVSR